MATDPVNGMADAGAVLERYRQEREKRLDAGRAGYFDPSGRYARFMDDPFVDAASAVTIDPVVIETDVALIGAGFGNLQAAVSLIKAGVEDFILIDRAADLGGVWYWNRYPGVACDIDSYIYMPLLEETGTIPTRKYAGGAEIFEHARRIGHQFDLYRRSLFRREIEELRWDAEASRWLVKTNRGNIIRARFVNLATGPLQRPRLPGIAGIERFKGHHFHTSRWDYAYTGGSAEGGLEGLRDKRVGIIGTGATSVQCIPHLARYAKHLYVFQRTPAMVPERNHKPTDPDWVKTLRPGWQQQRMDNFNILTGGGHQDEDLVDDGWTEILHRVGIEMDKPSDSAERQRIADLLFMEKIRGRIDSIVKDKDTAEKLKPWYNAGCKRPCFHDDYLETFNLPNVTLVDTDGKGVERITETAAIVGNEAYEVDCLIYATGFEFNTGDMAARNGFEIYGRDGLSLTEKWRSEGISTFQGYTMRGFPNLVVQGNAQGSLTPNITHALGAGGRHLAYLVSHCRDNELKTFEPAEQAERDYVKMIHSRAYRTHFDQQCTPGYYNNEGKAQEGAGISQFYPGAPHGFINMIEKWQAAGDLAGMETTPLT